MRRWSQERVVAYTLRGFMGVSVAAALGLLGYFVGWLLMPVSQGYSYWLIWRVFGVGIGAGIGGGAAWLRIGEGRSAALLTLGLGLLGGLAGAWLGIGCGRSVWDEELHHGSGTLRLVISFAAVLANTLPIFASIYWDAKSRVRTDPSLASAAKRNRR